jgi:hypothetical protein
VRFTKIDIDNADLTGSAPSGLRDSGQTGLEKKTPDEKWPGQDGEK